MHEAVHEGMEVGKFTLEAEDLGFESLARLTLIAEGHLEAVKVSKKRVVLRRCGL